MNIPYKDKEDRTEAVRRHRERQRDRQVIAAKMAKIDASLEGLLKLIGFQELPFEELVEFCQAIEKDEGVWYDRRIEKIIYPPGQVFFGLDAMIAGNHLADQVNAFALVFQDILDCEEKDDTDS